MARPEKKRKISPNTDAPTAPVTRASNNSFFNAPQPQTTGSQAQSSLPPQLLVLLAASLEKLSDTPALLVALIKALETHNAIEIIKLKREDEQKQAEQDAAAEAETADQKRFEDIRGSMYL